MSDLSAYASGQKIVVKAGTQRVSVVRSGPVGPPGPPGSNGTAISFEYTQVAPASSWVINHNLGYKPNFNVEEAGTGAGLEPAWIHHSNFQMELQFNTPRAGKARLS